LSMKKRIIALAAAAVAALALGGVNLAGHAGTARADGPSGYGNTPGIAVGCVNIVAGQSASLIQFNATTLQQVATNVPPTSTNNVNNNFYLTTPGNYLQCGVVLQGSNTPTPAPATATCTPTTGAGPYTCTATGQSDGNPNTVDTGNVTYTLASNGRFVILDNSSSTITIACAATLSNSEPPGFDQCQGAVPSATAGQITPNPSLVVKVGLAPGVPLGTFGTLPAAGFSFNLTATYTRTASPYAFTATCTSGNANAPGTCNYNQAGINAFFLGYIAGAFAPSATGNATACTAASPCVFNINLVPPGPGTASATVLLNLVAPTYAMYLTANPATIPATPPSGGAVASGAQGGGSTITAVLYTNNGPVSPLSYAPGAISPSAPVPGTASVVVSPTGSLLTLGVEPGTVTFQTNLGIFGSPATTSASAQQTVSVACGALPNFSLNGIVYNPATFGFGTFSFSSCTTATATLYGGGAAGTATILATYVGSVTGQTAQATTTVAIAAAPASVTLNRGCNEEITPASLASNSPVSAVVNLVSPSSAVVSVWQYNNATQKFNALYFNNPQAPVDQTTVSGSQSVFICVSSTATYSTGAY
jgi:hypothetical protein